MARMVEDVRHCSDWGRWRLVRAEPAPVLRWLVLGYQGYAEDSPREVWRAELPAMVFPVILNLGAPFRMRDGDACPVALDSFAAGIHERAVEVGSPGRARCLQFDLTPPGARRLFGLDLDAMAGRVMPLGDLIGQEAGLLVEELAGLRGWPDRIARLERWLVGRMAAGRPPGPATGAAWRALAATGGNLRIGALARAAGMSRQTLVQAFRREIGAAPKPAARILRLERAVELMVRPGPGLAEIAAACGYADQPHMSRELRALCGLSPAALRARMLPDGTGTMAGPD
jgi:AraC-like DNA-binding protein